MTKRGESKFNEVKERLEQVTRALTPGLTMHTMEVTFDETQINEYKAHLNKNVKKNEKEIEVDLFELAESSLTSKQREELKNTYLLIKIEDKQRLYYIENPGKYLSFSSPTHHLKDFTEIDKIITAGSLDKFKVDVIKIEDAEKKTTRYDFQNDASFKSKIECETNEEAYKLLPVEYQVRQYHVILSYQQSKESHSYDVPENFKDEAEKLHQAIESLITERNKFLYSSQFQHLKKLRDDEQNVVLKTKLTLLIDQIEVAKKNQPKSENDLTLVVEATCQLVDPEFTENSNAPQFSNYKKLAKRMQTSENKYMADVGSSMMAVGGVILFYGALLLGLSLLNQAPLTSFVVKFAGALVGGGLLLLPVGGVLFAASGPKGINKVMHEIHDETQKLYQPIAY